MGGAASAALANSTGGTGVSGHTSSSPSSSSGGASATAPTTAPRGPALHLAPVTGHSASLLYKGPVYQKLPTGQVVPYTAPAPLGQLGGATGGVPVAAPATGKPQLLVPGATARFVNGLAAAPMSAPPSVQAVVWAGNQIIGLPYVFGGGHASFVAPGYDCSGTVSFALHGASLLATPMDSSELMRWGGGGIGRWVTVFSNPGHAYMTIAGLRLDTSAADDPTNQQGPRWRPLRPGNGGFKVRHPLGF
jgi:cell wall-associated NlpC family hydrolase